MIFIPITVVGDVMLAEIPKETFDLISPPSGEVNDMVEFAEALVVDSDETYGMNYDLYCRAREQKNELEAMRKKLTEPLRRRMKYINDQAKPVGELLDRVIDATNRNANGYRLQLEMEYTKLIEATHIFQGGDVYVPPVESLALPGTMSTKTIQKFVVTDISAVPTKYLQIDEDAIEHDLKLGIGSIPGLTIYQEKISTLRVS